MTDRAAGSGTAVGLATAVAAAAVIGALVWTGRRRRPLRARVEPKANRVARNLAIAGVSAVVVQLAERPVAAPLSRWVERRRVGLLYWLGDRMGLPDTVRDGLAVVLLDYTLYWWHVVEHRTPALYRFHVVHHADLDLDASTALRFHAGELVASIPWRVAQIALLGVSPRALAAWQRLLVASILFHHSNIRLPIRLERWLSRFVMTPRLHGIHHSVVREEQDSNWSSGLAVWDRLHGTYRANVPQRDIEIGVPAYRAPGDVTLPRMLALPFGHAAPPWVRPDGSRPTRARSAAPRGTLLP